MTKKSYLKGGDVAVGSMDDMFWISEQYFKKTGDVAGKVLHFTPEQVKRKNQLLKNVRMLASKYHYTHSPAQRYGRFSRSFKKPLLDVKLKKLKKVSKRF